MVALLMGRARTPLCSPESREVTMPLAIATFSRLGRNRESRQWVLVILRCAL
jgi:hypothetical protein